MSPALRKGLAVGTASGVTAGLLYAAAMPGLGFGIGALAGLATGATAGVLWAWLDRVIPTSS